MASLLEVLHQRHLGLFFKQRGDKGGGEKNGGKPCGRDEPEKGKGVCRERRRAGEGGGGEGGEERGSGREGKGWTRTGETLMPFSPFFIFIICV